VLFRSAFLSYTSLNSGVILLFVLIAVTLATTLLLFELNNCVKIFREVIFEVSCFSLFKENATPDNITTKEKTAKILNSNICFMEINKPPLKIDYTKSLYKFIYVIGINNKIFYPEDCQESKITYRVAKICFCRISK
jgi:hypothetical protein